MKRDKIYQARMDGLAYAAELVKEGGLEALENEIKIRGAHFVPLEITAGKRAEICSMISNRIIATLTPTIMFALYTKFGFGKVRLQRWKDEFMSLCEMLAKKDPMGMPYETTRDYADVLHEKFGIEFDWGNIDEVVEDNAKYHVQMCELPYVINLLEEQGQAEAAQILRRYER